MFTVSQEKMNEWITEGLSEEEIEDQIEILKEEWYELLTGIDHLWAYLEQDPTDSDEFHFNNGIEYALEQLGLPTSKPEEA